MPLPSCSGVAFTTSGAYAANATIVKQIASRNSRMYRMRCASGTSSSEAVRIREVTPMSSVLSGRILRIKVKVGVWIYGGQGKLGIPAVHPVLKDQEADDHGYEAEREGGLLEDPGRHLADVRQELPEGTPLAGRAVGDLPGLLGLGDDLRRRLLLGRSLLATVVPNVRIGSRRG